MNKCLIEEIKKVNDENLSNKQIEAIDVEKNET